MWEWIAQINSQKKGVIKLISILEQSVKELDDLYSVIRDSGTISDKEFHSESAHDSIFLFFNSLAKHPEDSEKIIADFLNKYSYDLQKRSDRIIRRNTN
jgi:hypothetical protein